MLLSTKNLYFQVYHFYNGDNKYFDSLITVTRCHKIIVKIDHCRKGVSTH